MKRSVVALLIIGFLVPTSTLAHDQNKFDRKDAGGPFDLRFSGFDHRNGRLELCVGMHRKWRSRLLKRRESDSEMAVKTNYLWISLDTRGSNGLDLQSGVFPDYTVYFNYLKGRLKGQILNKRFRRIATVPAYRYSNRGACVEFKGRRIKPIDRGIRWQAGSSYQTQRACTRSACVDHTQIYWHRW